MLLGTSHWDGYTVFSVISGVLLVIMAFVPGIKPGARLTYVLVGIGMFAYGIWVAQQTSGIYFFPVYIFFVPVIAIATIIKSMGKGRVQVPRTSGRTAAVPVTRPVTTRQLNSQPSTHTREGELTTPLAQPSTRQGQAANQIPSTGTPRTQPGEKIVLSLGDLEDG